MDNKMYSQEEVEKIREEAISDNNKKMLLEFARKFNSTVSNNLVNANKRSTFSNKFNQETVARYLEDPISNESNLRKLSTVLLTMSPQYQQIINYFSSICKYVGIVSPDISKFYTSKGTVDDNKLKKEYTKAIGLLNKMNIHHEFQRITEIIFRDDVFYGFCHESRDSFYIQQLDSDYCRISSITDGCFNFQFNFAYFDSNKRIEGLDISLIETYPEEFQRKYKLYQKDKRMYQWQELSEENSICIKLLEGLPFNYSPYASLFDDLSDLNTYKELAKTKTEVDNYKFIGMQIPLNTKDSKPNSFMVDVETAMQFYNMLLNSLPDGVGAFISATDFKDINFGNGSSSTDITNNVKNAEDSVFNSAGVSSVNLGKNATNSSSINASNTVDSARLFKLYRQFERWLNRKFKREFNSRFTVQLLNITEFNIKEYKAELLKDAQYGVPVKLQLASLNGVTQNMERGLSYLENNILNLHEEWKPLVSSHVQSGNESTGGSADVGSDGSNKKDIGDIADSTEVGRDNDSNIDR